MASENFDKEYKRFIAGNEPAVDLKNLWSELEPNLPAQKKRRRVFSILLLGLGLLFLMVKLSGFTFGESDVVAFPNLEVSTKKQKTSAEDHSLNTLSEEKLSSTIASVQEGSLETAQIINLPKKETESISDNQLAITNFSEQINRGEIVQKNASNLQKNSSPPNEFKSSVAKKSMQGIISLPSNEVRQNVRESIPTLKQDRTEDYLDNDENVVHGTEPTLPKIDLLSGIHLKQFLIDRRQISMSVENVKRPNIPQENNNQFGSSIEIGSVFLIPSFVRSENPLTSFGTKLNEHIELSYGYQIFASYKHNLNKGFVLGLGLSHTSIIENFELKDQTITEGMAFNEQAYKVNDNFIGANQLGIITTTYNIFNRNSFQSFDLLPSIGYATNGRLSFGLDLQAIINLSQDYTGSLITEDLELIKAGELFEERKFKRIGGIIKAGLAYEFFDRLEVGLDVSFSQRVLIENGSGNFNVKKLNAMGIGVGVRYGL